MLLRRAILLRARLGLFDVDKDVLEIAKHDSESIRQACLFYLRKSKLRGKEYEETLLALMNSTMIKGNEKKLGAAFYWEEELRQGIEEIREAFPHLNSSLCAALLLMSESSEQSKAKAREFLLGFDPVNAEIVKPRSKHDYRTPDMTIMRVHLRSNEADAAVKKFETELKADASGKNAGALAGNAFDAILQVRP